MKQRKANHKTSNHMPYLFPFLEFSSYSVYRTLHAGIQNGQHTKMQVLSNHHQGPGNLQFLKSCASQTSLITPSIHRL
ncbi:Os06g0128450 [Oryza sativa Japonica Group]|uniref:Os06g0128450 protein n=1 Tax=Oryza sativa subsp. japonica TaxID=39947 RepID=A0A0P0WSI8_ORYSJ|nr:Os06g0128450 [Oryza sativa Japonica Group]